MQWRCEDFGLGESWPPKCDHTHPQGSGWRAAPRMVAKFHFLKRFKVLKINPFSQISRFSCPRNFPFSKKNFEKLNKFYKNFRIFRNFSKFSSIWSHSIYQEKFPMNSIIELRNLSKTSKIAQMENEYWKRDENS